MITMPIRKELFIATCNGKRINDFDEYNPYPRCGGVRYIHQPGNSRHRQIYKLVKDKSNYYRRDRLGIRYYDKHKYDKEIAI